MTPAAAPLRVAVFSELPTPYRWPVFARLLERPELDLRIRFCARTEPDRAFRFDFRPGRNVKFLPAHTFSFTGRRTVHYHVNPTVFGELERLDPAVVVLPGYAMFVSQAAGIWCRARKTPYVMFSETTATGPRRRTARLLKRLFVPGLVSGASAWLATGTRSGRYLESWGADRARTWFFPNSPDVAAFGRAAEAAAPGRDALRRRLGASRSPVVLFVGRLLPVKRPDLLIEAERLRRARDGDPADLWFVGEGPEREELSRRALETGIAVRFLGQLPSAELPAVYDAADVFVLPSDHEPWGAVVGEAMACGLPVVLSDRVGSSPDLLTPGENGEEFAAGDAEALSRSLDRLLSDRDLRLRMGRRSREIIARFSHERCVESFLAAVKSAASGGP